MGVKILAYNATYSDSDLAPVVIDTAVKTGVGVGAFAGILGLLIGILLVVLVWKKMTK